MREFALDCGQVLPVAKLAYRVVGDVRARPPIVTCTAFSQSPADLGFLQGPGCPLDGGRRGQIRTELLGNGRSLSPSNAQGAMSGADFPIVTIADNVRLQARLLDHLDIARVGCVLGASMGGQQAVEWAVRFPHRVGSAVAIAATARTTFYGKLFLHTVASALRSDPDFADGRYQAPPRTGLARMSETWAAFALSPRFFSTGRWAAHADMSAPDLAGFLAKWRTRYFEKDANDLVSHLEAWARHDVAGGDDLAKVAGATRVPLLFAPISTDAYFSAEDVADQATLFPNARVEVIDSLSGHAAAFGREMADQAAVASVLERFLTEQGL